jgi:hypothetical protein
VHELSRYGERLLAEGASAATFYPLKTSSYQGFVLAMPGSEQWSNWFASRAPTEPQGDQLGQHRDQYLALDYDLVFATSIPVSLRAAGLLHPDAVKRVTRGHRAARSPFIELASAPTGQAAAAPPAGCDCSCAPPAPKRSKRAAAP